MPIEDEIKNSDFALVKFYSPSCGPCKVLAPIVDELAERYKGRLKLINVDIYESTELARKYGIQSVPTILFVKKGEIAGRMTGMHDRKFISEKIEEYLSEN